MRHLLVKELLTGFGVHQKFFLQKNSIFYLRTLNQREFLLKKSHGIDLQLTFGATHQGVALQSACSKTISLDKLIDISKNSSNPIILALDGITDHIMLVRL